MKNETPNEPVAESETSKPLPKEKADTFYRGRMLTPSELQSLKDDHKESEKIMRGRFKDLA